MPKFIEGKAPLVVKKCKVGKEAAGAYFVIKGLVVDNTGAIVEYLVTRFRINNTNQLNSAESTTSEYSEEEFIKLVSEFGHLFADYQKYGGGYKLRYAEFPVYRRSKGIRKALKLVSHGKERFLASLAEYKILFADCTGDVRDTWLSSLPENFLSSFDTLVGSLGNRIDSKYVMFMRKDINSADYIKESARSRLVGDNCCGSFPSEGQFSLLYRASLKSRSYTGVCNVPSIATSFYSDDWMIEDCRVKVISFKSCLVLQEITLFRGRGVKDSLTVVMPSKSLFGAPKVSIAGRYKEFRLDGKCKRLDLTLSRLERLYIEQESLSDAKVIRFANCNGVRSLFFKRASIVSLYNTDTEELSCHVPLGVSRSSSGVNLRNCRLLKTVMFSSDKFNPSVLNSVIHGCTNLEELLIATDSLILNGSVVSGGSNFEIDLCKISKKLKRFSLTLTSRFGNKAIVGSKGGVVANCRIIAPRGSEVILRGDKIDKGQFFTVTYK